MSYESAIYTALKVLVNNRVYRDIAPPESGLPRITFQQVGGTPINFLEGGKPAKKNARVQINCWGAAGPSGRDDVMALARLVEDTMREAAGLQATVLTAPIATYEENTRLYGAMQDFSVWYSD